MVINNFDIFRVSLGPSKANLELPVDSDAVLTLAITKQWLQHIPGRYFKIIQLACNLELPNFWKSGDQWISIPNINHLNVDSATLPSAFETPHPRVAGHCNFSEFCSTVRTKLHHQKSSLNT